MKRAFPFKGEYTTNPGMSMRDYFAGQALAGIMANNNLMPLNSAYDANIIHRAVDLAEQLCAALENKGDNQ